MAKTVDSAPEAQVASGRLRGLMDQGVAAFLGIPYAAPPFGARRLRHPDGHAPRPGPVPPGGHAERGLRPGAHR
ncbi:carboxylesterase family protein [Nonomuraea insulae]|uniref:Carboxylesterase family protein n=1 Tax=Nonomuraea insulae TaxID=1616787 RepID=A0ABW1DBE4_9ACTN